MAQPESRLSMRRMNRTLLSTIVLALSLLSAPGAGAMRRAATQPTESKQVTVAIVLFDGVQIIDYSGPWEVFGQAGFKVFTVVGYQRAAFARGENELILIRLAKHFSIKCCERVQTARPEHSS